jgi:hypothetical protein
VTGVLPDPQTNPGEYIDAICGQVLALADRSEKLRLNLGLALPGAVHDAVNAVLGRCSPAMLWAQVALWRGVAERHRSLGPIPTGEPDEYWWQDCEQCGMPWICPDLLAVVAACRAYAGGEQ